MFNRKSSREWDRGVTLQMELTKINANISNSVLGYGIGNRGGLVTPTRLGNVLESRHPENNEKTCQNAENKQTFDLTGKIEIEGKTRQNAESKQTFEKNRKYLFAVKTLVENDTE